MMKTKSYLMLLMTFLMLSCSNDDSEYQVAESMHELEYLKMSTAEYSKITEKIKEQVEILDQGIDEKQFREINAIINEYSDNNVANKNFESMLMVYNQALKEKGDNARLKYYLKNYDDFLDYDKELDLVVLKIIPEEAALLNSKGLIKLDDKIVKLSFDSKKTIHNGDVSLIKTLSSVKEATDNITVEYFEDEIREGSIQKIKHTWRNEVFYPISTPRRGKYHVIGTNTILLHIFRGIFIREYVYYVYGTFQPFYDYAPITAPSASCSASYQHTGNDSDFASKYGSSQYRTFHNAHVFRTPRGRIHLRRLRKKLDIADELRVTTQFKITYPDGYVFESGYSNDRPKTDDIPIFD